MSMEDQQEDHIFDISILTYHSKLKFINILDNFPGSKVLVFDTIISKKIQFIIDSESLSDNGVKEMYYLDSENIHSELDQIMFIIPPDPEQIKLISKIILNDQRQGKQKSYAIIFTPQKTQISMESLEKSGVFSNVQTYNFNFDFIPLETDLLTLDIEDAFEKINLQKDQTIYQQIADSIQRVELLYGQFQKIFVKGDAAKSVLEVILSREKEGRVFQESQTESSCLESLIIIDRVSDLVTPFSTPFTYQALVDEYFGIQNQSFSVDQKTILGEKEDGLKSINIGNNSKDIPLFRELRGQNIKIANKNLEELKIKNKKLVQEIKEPDNKSNFKNITEQLKKAKKIQNEYSTLIEYSAVCRHICQKIDQITFHKSFKTEIDIILHTNHDNSLEHIENLIAMGQPIDNVLRLLILYSQVSNGVKEKYYDHLKKEIIQQYGFQYCKTLQLLEEKLFIKKQTEKSHWEVLIENLNLINDEVDQEHPNDFSYVYLAYSPITVRLVEQTLKRDHWKNIKRELAIIPGTTLYNDYRGEISKKKTLIFVMYIGGVTYGEIACLRWLSKKYNKEIIIGCTNIINSKKILKTFKINENKIDILQTQEILNEEENQ